MMQNDLFRHGSGDPLSKGSPWKGIPHYSSLQSLNPGASASALSISNLAWGILHGLEGPKPSTPPLKQGPLRLVTVKKTYTHNTHSPPRETPSDPGNPFYRSLTAAKTPQSPQTGCLTRPGNPPHLPFALGQSPPPPEEVEPLPGIPPRVRQRSHLQQPGGFCASSSSSSSSSPSPGASTAPPAPAAPSRVLSRLASPLLHPASRAGRPPPGAGA